MDGWRIPVLVPGLTFSYIARGLLALFYYIYCARAANEGCTCMPMLLALFEFCKMNELDRSWLPCTGWLG
jgi:hypothetical protein